MTIGENIRKYRVANKLSQKELGDKLGVTNTAVSYWECGKKHPSIKNLQEIADIFDISFSLLIDADKTDLTVKDEKFVQWFRSLSLEKQRAILIALDGPEDVVE